MENIPGGYSGVRREGSLKADCVWEIVSELLLSAEELVLGNLWEEL